jgi:hypothetical protein
MGGVCSSLGCYIEFPPNPPSGGIFNLPSNPLNLNPQRMLLDLGQQQDFVLLLFGDLKGIGTGDALTFRMDGKG